jgi:hypothetical protein
MNQIALLFENKSEYLRCWKITLLINFQVSALGHMSVSEDATYLQVNWNYDKLD